MPTQKIASPEAESSRPYDQSPAEGEECGPGTSSDVVADGRPNSSLAASALKQPQSNTNLIKSNPKKRARSPQSPPQHSSQVKTNAGQYHDVVTKQQNIEMITQKEALHHVEMAWRAQQRLVQRCLGLRLFGEPQSTGTNDDDNAGKGGNAARPSIK
mmetsp:Transcript_8742/g.19606  ORF Transcript_8742/g.19606 Transcript_8742/m.19606 type:complete len:157 (+) Transcript_8742:252-722(+)|eukprot:CAMPEP_0172317660 /NCGR_PEP_ID=MMETSP1058-20130122/32373_1 /TAXON_ID=83371 /ORGANISM="Detonula confervacea, Strain CCMP 353" /LENGTH=156 /DNA_ID=CAMNT_0013032277 /DNA_START=182 /DNA_END=652 /DNA_ORIENTATION=-